MRDSVKKRVYYGTSLLLLFITLSLINLIVMRNKILDSAQIMGNEIAAHLLTKEEKRRQDSEIFLRTAGKWLEKLIRTQRSKEYIQSWMKEYQEYMGEELNSPKVAIYAVINDKIVQSSNFGENLSFKSDDVAWYRKALKNPGKIVYTDLYKDSKTGEDVFTVAMVIDEHSDVLAMNIYVKDLAINIDEKFIYPKGTYYYLCDSKGNIVYMKSEFLNDENLQKHLKDIIIKINQGKHRKSNSFTYDNNGVKRAVYYSKSQEGWYSIITIPYSTLLSDMINLYYLYLAGTICFGIVGFLIFKRDLKVNNIVEENNEIIRALGNSFYSIYKINVKKETYVTVKAPTGIIEKVGKAGSYSYLKETLAKSISESAKEEFRTAFSINNIKMLIEKRVRDFEGDFKKICKEEYRWTNISLLYDEALNPNEIILCLKDIDREKRKNLEHIELLKESLNIMEKNTQLKNIFFSSMSHDMRTPLNGIIGLSEIAKEYVKKPEKILDYLEKINISSKQLLNLINETLEISKMESNKSEILEEEFLLKERLKDILELFILEAKRIKRVFKIDYDIEHNFVKSDFNKISQILNNILSNAFKYTREGGEITIVIKELERGKYSNYSFEISDNGYGMTKEFLEKIYVPFEREITFGARGIMGTGLGMAIVKNLVSQLDGEIEIKSELDKGTTVKILIPMEIINGEIEEKIEETERALLNFKGKKVIVAEDNEINMDIMTEILKMKQIDVLQAWNGKEAVELFSNSEIDEIDLIFMDMQMPKLNGCDATRKIRELPRRDAKKVPIVAVTANAFAEDIAATTMAGMDSHISKPIDFKVLEKILEEYLTKEGRTES